MTLPTTYRRNREPLRPYIEDVLDGKFPVIIPVKRSRSIQAVKNRLNALFALIRTERESVGLKFPEVRTLIIDTEEAHCLQVVEKSEWMKTTRRRK